MKDRAVLRLRPAPVPTHQGRDPEGLQGRPAWPMHDRERKRERRLARVLEGLNAKSLARTCSFVRSALKKVQANTLKIRRTRNEVSDVVGTQTTYSAWL